MSDKSQNAPPSLGLEALKKALKTLPQSPGSYRMLDGDNQVLYVGKAKNIKARVRSYTHWDALPTRLKRMVHQTRRLEVIVTHSEAEAFLLEANLIARYKPPFNVLLKDDKSFPYILMAQDHAYPQLLIYRGPKTRKGVYFGPFPSSSAVHETFPLLQKAFLLRSCSDSFFEGRKRPCLLYDIKRCSGPCVGKISEANYKTLVLEAKDFLKGRSHSLQGSLRVKMLEASHKQDYEEARILRDRLRALGYIQSQQNLALPKKGRSDIIGFFQEGAHGCLQIFSYQNGQTLGNHPYFITLPETEDKKTLLNSLLLQFYTRHDIPDEIMMPQDLVAKELLLEALLSLKHQRDQKGLKLTTPSKGPCLTFVQQAQRNAQEALDRSRAEALSFHELFQRLQRTFGLATLPKRIEVYDNSHLQGTHAYGVMIVVNQEGFMKSAYRKFLIKDALLTPGDDYAMMRHVLSRRLKSIMKHPPLEPEASDAFPSDKPDLILLDGGRGQLSVVHTLMQELEIKDIEVGAIAKGPQRSEEETLYRIGLPPLQFEKTDPFLYFLQKIRDEAHRFAITTHRKKRLKNSLRSQLDEIPGIGPSRKRALLSHFGSTQDIARASLSELEKVEGISEFLASSLYSYFHET